MIFKPGDRVSLTWDSGKVWIGTVLKPEPYDLPDTDGVRFDDIYYA